MAILLRDPADELPRGRQRFTTHNPSCRVVVLHAATVDMDATPFNVLFKKTRVVIRRARGRRVAFALLQLWRRGRRLAPFIRVEKRIECRPRPEPRLTQKVHWPLGDWVLSERTAAVCSFFRAFIAKRWRAADHAPEGVNKEVYASLFTGTNAHKREDETFLSRNARRGW